MIKPLLLLLAFALCVPLAAAPPRRAHHPVKRHPTAHKRARPAQDSPSAAMNAIVEKNQLALDVESYNDALEAEEDVARHSDMAGADAEREGAGAWEARLKSGFEVRKRPPGIDPMHEYKDYYKAHATLPYLDARGVLLLKAMDILKDIRANRFFAKVYEFNPKPAYVGYNRSGLPGEAALHLHKIVKK